MPRAGTPPAGEAGASFFNEVEAAYHRAAQAAGVTHASYRLRAHTLRLGFAGEALRSAFTPALEHLRVLDNPAADLTVRLWDVASTAVSPPRRAWAWRDNPARGEVRSLSDDRFAVAYSPFARMLSALDRSRDLALCAVADIRESGDYLAATPLLDILHWWLQGRGLHTVHGGAIGTEAGGVLLAGRGGAGKSTTTLACLSSRLRFAGDDYCVLSVGDGPAVYSLYNSARITADAVRRLPHLRPLVDNPAALDSDADKATLYLHRHRPATLIDHFPLRAVVLPRITGEAASRLVPTSRSHGLRELAASTLNQRAGAGRATFAAVAAAVRHVPCYRLDLGTDLRALAELLDGFVIAMDVA